MTNTAHSRIGASSLKRWGNCPGSVAASVGMPNFTSGAAAEGTVAHGIAELLLKQKLLGESVTLPAVGSTQTVEGHAIEIDQEMYDFVSEYVEAVVAEASQPDCTVWVECKFDLSSIHPGMFGTADAVVWNPRTGVLTVFDLKYGKGIAVEVTDNEQLQFYAVGAMIKTGIKPKKISIRIVQPRRWHADGTDRAWETTPLDLLDFAGDLKQKALATEDPNAPFAAGEWCRFCPAAGKPCPTAEAKAREVAASEFGSLDPNAVPAPKYDPVKLGETLRWLPFLESFVKSVHRFAFFEALQGRGSASHKLVAGRAERSWRDEAVASRWLLLEFGIASQSMYEQPPPPKLKSVAQIEKLPELKGKDAKQALARLYSKQSNGVSLVPIEDKREAVKRDALSEFSSLATDTETDTET